ncbi:hypothetical protein AVEN_101030-1 [Araneus ventricosus]|uniref:Uncharacterized protein n=1 Tax=Araneus ventricosus TaxID=182803 RepID=A0A4Y2KBR8_ARAVE|nr:hypothetical protein AVEN_101030-1 [Araneus ventricosus]
MNFYNSIIYLLFPIATVLPVGYNKGWSTLFRHSALPATDFLILMALNFESSLKSHLNCMRNTYPSKLSSIQNRKVILNTCEGPAIRDQKQGCPQGSCSGPSLWNLVQMKYLKKPGQLTPSFKPLQMNLSWFPMPRLEFNLSYKLANLLIKSPPGKAKTNSKLQLIKQLSPSQEAS